MADTLALMGFQRKLSRTSIERKRVRLGQWARRNYFRKAIDAWGDLGALPRQIPEEADTIYNMRP